MHRRGDQVAHICQAVERLVALGCKEWVPWVEAAEFADVAGDGLALIDHALAADLPRRQDRAESEDAVVKFDSCLERQNEREKEERKRERGREGEREREREKEREREREHLERRKRAKS